MGQITGYITLGMWAEAWEALEDAHENFRASAEGWMLRVKIAPHVNAWAIGEVTAELLRHGDAPHKAAAAHFFHLLAIHHAVAGRIEDAKEAVRKAAKTDPDCRLAMLDDPSLRGLL